MNAAAGIACRWLGCGARAAGKSTDLLSDVAEVLEMLRSGQTLQICSLFYLALLIGCSSEHALMQTPNVFADLDGYPANEIPERLRNNRVELLYVTDRTMDTSQDGEAFYGAGRSTSSAYGSVVVEIGNAEPWEELVAASQTQKREHEFQLRINSMQEYARFPETPHPFSVVDGEIVEDEETQAAFNKTAAKFRDDP